MAQKSVAFSEDNFLLVGKGFTFEELKNHFLLITNAILDHLNELSDLLGDKNEEE